MSEPSSSPWPQEPDNYGHEETGEEVWLVSYADLMTLLFGFFAMLFTFATFDDDAYVKMRKELARYFGGTYAQAAGGDDSGSFKGSSAANPAANLAATDLKQTEDGLEIGLITGVTFKSGGTELTPEAITALKGLSTVIQELTVPFKRRPEVRIEGHTDDTPLSGKGLFRSNWELSAARAGAIAQQLVSLGLEKESISALGYADSRPVVPNRDARGQPLPTNKERNRRVVLKVIFPRSEGTTPSR